MFVGLTRGTPDKGSDYQSNSKDPHAQRMSPQLEITIQAQNSHVIVALSCLQERSSVCLS